MQYIYVHLIPTSFMKYHSIPLVGSDAFTRDLSKLYVMLARWSLQVHVNPVL